MWSHNNQPAPCTHTLSTRFPSDHHISLKDVDKLELVADAAARDGEEGVGEFAQEKRRPKGHVKTVGVCNIGKVTRHGGSSLKESNCKQ